jgi:hypothetical protein
MSFLFIVFEAHVGTFIIVQFNPFFMPAIIKRRKRAPKIGDISTGEWQQAFVANKKGGIIGVDQRVFVPPGEKFQERYYTGQFGKRSNI